MQVTLSYKKGQNKGTISMWTNDPEQDTQELIQEAKKKIESHSDKPLLKGDEKWKIVRNIL